MENYSDWHDFTWVLCQEFGHSELDDSAESLVNLKQTGTLRDYVIEFQRLANRMRDISPALLKSCFVGSLKPKLRHDVKILRPRVVLEVTAFAQQLDAKIANVKVKTLSKTHSIQPISRYPLQSFNSNAPSETRMKPSNIKKMTPEEVDHCRRNGLCFHCKEKYVRGHTCEKKQLLLIDVQDTICDENEELETEEPEITTCALFGTSAPSINTMKVCGSIKNCPATILIDSGSSHNFVDVGLVKRLRKQLDTKHLVNVKITDRRKVATKGTLAHAPVKIQDF